MIFIVSMGRSKTESLGIAATNKDIVSAPDER
jgi:hypothetical protein